MCPPLAGCSTTPSIKDVFVSADCWETFLLWNPSSFEAPLDQHPPIPNPATMAQASPSWQRLMGLLSVLLALLLGVSAGSHGAAAAGCPADIASAPESTWSVDFDNRTDVAETQSESSYVVNLKDEVTKLEATSLHGMGARSGFEAFAVEIPASCHTPSMKSSLIELPISFASLHMHLQNIRTK
ncbi:hypothetical protein CDEST_03908 [Colletotrichum destructivum]|uniref:Uncharacterized protein n=2 Tax=Colletotrichum destructivum species complex TaxID=2707350 RepID=A0AAX4I7I3_9PEZI|nr:hypothetical protein CDEST_03908 [Colletotrichum destructivum]